MKKLTFFWLTAFVLLSGCLWSQSATHLTRSHYMMVTTGIDAKTVDTLIRTVDSTFRVFQSVSTLRDPKANQVTQNSIDAFNSMFENNANVPKDYVFIDPCDEIKAPDYSVFVYREMSAGLSVSYSTAECTNINQDALGYYRVFVRVVKKFENGIEENNKYVRKDSCIRVQFFTFFVEKNNMKQALIFQIKNSGDLFCVDKHVKWPLSITGSVYSGIGRADYTSGDNWPGQDSMRTRFSGNSIKTVGFSGQIRYRMPKKSFEFYIGAQYGRFRTSVGLDTFIYSFSTVDSLDQPLTNYNRRVSIGHLKETGTIQTWQIPIGITWWTMERERFSLGFDFGLAPGRVVFYSSKTEAQLSYASEYNYENIEGRRVRVTIYDQLPNPNYLIGRNYQLADSLQNKLNYQASRLFMAVQFNPTAEWQITEHLRLRGGVCFQASLSNWFNSSDQPNRTPFGYRPSDIQSAILSEYTQKFRVTHFGLQLGLRYSL